ncbi:MAG: ribosomal L27 [Lasallia pustulata]|uniref:Large ribosomal subunit protein bL27m n=1 Tax=Lasallia pustulata TaxID=136370 RepID=A0A5M8PWW6_9LECA|nr:MAG: ribosomal L27 [Lasallia pustulata]
MILQRTRMPMHACSAALNAPWRPSSTLDGCLNALIRLQLSSAAPLTCTQVRHATHATEGRANRAKRGPGKRLGAKKSGEELVVPGNIIFKQRGTLWFPGDNCGMGRDHTIFALQKGYVKYYKDPEKHPKRKYIGVVFNRDDPLPLPRNSARRRRLGMVAAEMSTLAGNQEVEAADDELMDDNISKDVPKVRREATAEKEPPLRLGPRYMYRQPNWQIGRAAERANIKVRSYKRGDRWLAWRKVQARKAKNAERRGMRKRK